MIKIAVVGTRGFPGIQGGIESHCENLYTHLAKADCNITVFTRESYTSPNSYKYKGVTLIPVKCPKNKFLEAIIHTFKSVIKAWQMKPDILHIHAVGPSLFAPLAKMLGMKVVVTNHGPDYERKKWPLPAKIFLKFCERQGILFANEVITIANNIADEIFRKYRRKTIVLPNGVNIPRLTESAKFLKEIGLEKKKYILSVGRFVPEKGFDNLIDAFIHGSFDSLKLVLAGDADHEDKYSRDLKKRVTENRNIIMTGFIKGQPLHELYTHAGLFVLPSLYEGLPIVLLEAMSYGLSCIASDIQANKNVELNEDRFFATGDDESLMKKIKKYINKTWGEEEINEQIRLIRDKYSWSIIGEETLKVYKRIIIKQ